MDKITRQVRIEHWTQIMNECLNSGMNKTEWCRARKLLKISCVSDGVVRRYLFVQILLVSIEAIRPKSGQRDWHT